MSSLYRQYWGAYLISDRGQQVLTEAVCWWLQGRLAESAKRAESGLKIEAIKGGRRLV